MSAKDGKCDRCVGSGIIKLQLFFSIVDDPCPLCKGNGEFIYMCEKCGKNKALTSKDLQGHKYLHPCQPCAAVLARQNMVTNTTAATYTFGITNVKYNITF